MDEMEEAKDKLRSIDLADERPRLVVQDRQPGRLISHSIPWIDPAGLWSQSPM
jgi:hypothetical protein